MRSTLGRYVFALLLSAIAIAITASVPYLHTRPYLVSIAAVALTAWVSGFWPALFSTLVSTIAVNVLLARLGPWGLVEITLSMAFVLSACVVAFIFRARVNAEREAQRHSNRLEAMFGQASVGIAMVSLDGRFTRVNAKMADVLGRSPREIETLTCDAVVHPDERELVKGAVAQLAAGALKEFAIDLRYVRPDGSAFWVHASVTPLLDRDGRPEGLVAIVQDVHERRLAELQLQRSEEALRQADREKDDFLALLAHELRNPLAPIRHAVELLKMRGPADAEGRKLYAVIDRQVHHLVRMVDDLLDVSRVLRGKVEIRSDTVNLADVAVMAIETARPLIDARTQHLETRWPERPVAVHGDQVRLAQVVANLLNNASKYTNTGGRIRLTIAEEGTEAVVRVADTGAGIAAEMLPRIFEPFVQADRTLERTGGGLGIGLTLVSTIVELHGGHVTASSAGPGQGSEFMVRLPRVEGAESPPAPAPIAAHRPTPGLRLLVVDDNVDACASLAMLLETAGHTVTTAYDGKEAIRQVEAVAPDVVVLDIGLPQMSGYEVAATLRQQCERCPELIAVTGYGQTSDAQRALDAGFRFHLVKPVDAEDLFAAIDSCATARTNSTR